MTADLANSEHTHASSQAHIIEILERMGSRSTKVASEGSHVHTSMSGSIVLYASNEEIDDAGMHRVENVLSNRVKAWARVLLPNLRTEAES